MTIRGRPTVYTMSTMTPPTSSRQTMTPATGSTGSRDDRIDSERGKRLRYAGTPRPIATHSDGPFKVAKELQAWLRFLVTHKKYQTMFFAAGGAGICFGALGAAAGLAAGGGTGAALGIIPAPFTFGISIPMGGIAGGVVGASAGATLGGGAGFIGGGVAGRVGYVYRVEILDGIAYLTAVVKDASRKVQVRIVRSSPAIGMLATTLTRQWHMAEGRYKRFMATKSKEFNTTVVAAAGTAAGGAAAGLFGGVLAGGAIGTVAAPFTFGLSIPIGVCIGGGVGFCAGATGGGCAGAVGGGAIAYGHAWHQERLRGPQAETSYNLALSEKGKLIKAAWGSNNSSRRASKESSPAGTPASCDLKTLAKGSPQSDYRLLRSNSAFARATAPIASNTSFPRSSTPLAPLPLGDDADDTSPRSLTNVRESRKESQTSIRVGSGTGKGARSSRSPAASYIHF